MAGPAASGTLLLYCRAGFEAECAQEIQALAAERQVAGHCRTERDSAFVRFVQDSDTPFAPAWRELIFARQSLLQLAELKGMDPRDRIAPMLEVLAGRGQAYADAWVETPDSAQGAQLKGLSRGLEAALIAALRKQGRLDGRSPLRLHVLLLDGIHALLAQSRIADAAPWPMGIPRLKLPRDAPSRSALKIEEAWLTLMDAGERERWFAPGMTAVDLGAAPGGWTWQLARRGLRVTAIDNGPLAPQVTDTGVVTHLREDGFRYRPGKPVDWLVCDMVEQPIRIATLVGEWLAAGHARAALFNLKLPMKKRWQETQRCFAALGEAVALVGAASAATGELPPCVPVAAKAAPTGRSRGNGQRGFELRARQLYHDREEITVIALPR